MSGAQVPALQTQARRFQGARVPAGCEVGRTCRTALLSSHGARCPGMLPSRCTTCTTRAGTIGGPARKSCPLAQSLRLCRTKDHTHRHRRHRHGHGLQLAVRAMRSDSIPAVFPRGLSADASPALSPALASHLSRVPQGGMTCRTVREVFVPCEKSLPCLRPSLLP